MSQLEQFRACFNYRPTIEKRTVIKETEKTVLYIPSFAGKEIRENKIGPRHKWFKTHKEAKEFLIEKSCARIAFIKRQLGTARSDLQNIQGLKYEQSTTCIHTDFP